jgi:PadR family transcriptional regulator, regulatory protein AphA
LKQTNYVILGLLSESPLTGYEIKKVIDIRFRYFWSESYGQLYPTLKELNKKGLINVLKSEGKEKRSRITYQITKEGFAVLHSWLGQPVERESVRLEILLKMYFSHLIKPEVMIKHIRDFQSKHEEDLFILNLFEQELKAILDKDPNHPHVLRVIDFGQRVNQAYLDWSRETIKFIESKV